jgi:hypothetical protein
MQKTLKKYRAGGMVWSANFGGRKAVQMGQKVLEQTVECSFNRKVCVVVDSDGAVSVSGASRVGVLLGAERMSCDIEKLAPKSGIGVDVVCGGDGIEAEMFRWGAPWVGPGEGPRMVATFYSLSTKEICFNVSAPPRPVPIGSLEEAVA